MSAPEPPPEPPQPSAGAAPDGALDRRSELAPTEDQLPAADFWRVLYGRRSIRRFDERPVSRELIDRVLHAGTWAPSSCNYQMWDVVAVDDPKLNAELAGLSTQMGNAPVNLVVSYGRDFSEEGWANIQSASAMIQNMSLAAEALGLGTFWITQMGDREQVATPSRARRAAPSAARSRRSPTTTSTRARRSPPRPTRWTGARSS
jgi:hypothetical protein